MLNHLTQKCLRRVIHDVRTSGAEFSNSSYHSSACEFVYKQLEKCMHFLGSVNSTGSLAMLFSKYMRRACASSLGQKSPWNIIFIRKEVEDGLKKRKEIQKNHQKFHESTSFKSALSSPDGNISRVLQGGMPKLAGAETKAKAKKAWELIYKDGTTLKGNHPPKTMARTPGTPILGHSHSSLIPPCYNMSTEQNKYTPHNTAPKPYPLGTNPPIQTNLL